MVRGWTHTLLRLASILRAWEERNRNYAIFAFFVCRGGTSGYGGRPVDKTGARWGGRRISAKRVSSLAITRDSMPVRQSIPCEPRGRWVRYDWNTSVVSVSARSGLSTQNVLGWGGFLIARHRTREHLDCLHSQGSQLRPLWSLASEAWSSAWQGARNAL